MSNKMERAQKSEEGLLPILGGYWDRIALS